MLQRSILFLKRSPRKPRDLFSHLHKEAPADFSAGASLLFFRAEKALCGIIPCKFGSQSLAGIFCTGLLFFCTGRTGFVLRMPFEGFLDEFHCMDALFPVLQRSENDTDMGWVAVCGAGADQNIGLLHQIAHYLFIRPVERGIHPKEKACFRFYI